MIEPRPTRFVRATSLGNVGPTPNQTHRNYAPPATCQCGARLSRYRKARETTCAPCQAHHPGPPVTSRHGSRGHRIDPASALRLYQQGVAPHLIASLLGYAHAKSALQAAQQEAERTDQPWPIQRTTS